MLGWSDDGPVPIDVRARSQLVERCGGRGLEVRCDGVGDAADRRPRLVPGVRGDEDEGEDVDDDDRRDEVPTGRGGADSNQPAWDR